MDIIESILLEYYWNLNIYIYLRNQVNAAHFKIIFISVISLPIPIKIISVFQTSQIELLKHNSRFESGEFLFLNKNTNIYIYTYIWNGREISNPAFIVIWNFQFIRCIFRAYENIGSENVWPPHWKKFNESVPYLKSFLLNIPQTVAYYKILSSPERSGEGM